MDSKVICKDNIREKDIVYKTPSGRSFLVKGPSILPDEMTIGEKDFNHIMDNVISTYDKKGIRGIPEGSCLRNQI